MICAILVSENLYMNIVVSDHQSTLEQIAKSTCSRLTLRPAPRITISVEDLSKVMAANRAVEEERKNYELVQETSLHRLSD